MTSGLLLQEFRPEAINLGLGSENGKQGSRVTGIMRKNWLPDF